MEETVCLPGSDVVFGSLVTAGVPDGAGVPVVVEGDAEGLPVVAGVVEAIGVLTGPAEADGAAGLVGRDDPLGTGEMDGSIEGAAEASPLETSWDGIGEALSKEGFREGCGV